ncbi:DUF747-domain-containing protein [Anaeromyces robustus]|uniref:DUF747-domain-containing protein n=1 Tax=Anaeromyces robustus TaxID=1754192 RepID=A0A1Y1XAV7_9FUNG|nr:DUF747-domain-containing protein [Anaeromyces robustus]|eukprot:ORX82885.1 DUF747-domain-containing protein [Anaeromyces robustus]
MSNNGSESKLDNILQENNIEQEKGIDVKFKKKQLDEISDNDKNYHFKRNIYNSNENLQELKSNNSNENLSLAKKSAETENNQNTEEKLNDNKIVNLFDEKENLINENNETDSNNNKFQNAYKNKNQSREKITIIDKPIYIPENNNSNLENINNSNDKVKKKDDIITNQEILPIIEDHSEPYLIRSNSLPNLLPSQIYTTFSSEQSSTTNTPIVSSHDLLSEAKLNSESVNASLTNFVHNSEISSEASIATLGEIDGNKKNYYHEKSKLCKSMKIDNKLNNQKSSSLNEIPSIDIKSPTLSSEKEIKNSNEDFKEKNDNDVKYPEFYRNPWIFLKSEIYGEDAIPEKLSELKKERIQNFLAVPVELEKFLNYGILICLDSFLYIFTILPIRLIVAVFSMIKGLFVKETFKTRHKSDILKGLLILFCCIALQYIDVSRLYHFVRGQNIVKLYLIYNLMENFDKLCSAFGHDVLDSLFAENIIKKSNKGSRFPVVVHFVVALIYLILHTVVLFYLVVSLNVAINSYNNALLSFLISNQFGEIKSSVFKRFERENLFQLTCADIVERFQILVFLVIITGRNFLELTGTGAETLSHFYTLFSKSILSPASFSSFIPKLDILQTFQSSNFPEFCEKIVNLVVSKFTNFLNSPTYQLLAVLVTPVVVIYGSEMFVDYLKHTFITKFNQIKPSVYTKYKDSLCKDFAGTKKFSDNQILDRSGYVSRRIGFVSIPLACLTIRIIMQTLKMFGYLYIDGDSLHIFSIHNFFKNDGSINYIYAKRAFINFIMIFIFLLIVYICVLVFKIYLSLYIHKLSYKRVQEMKKEKENESTENKAADIKRLMEDGPVDHHQYQRQPNDIPPQRDDKLDKIDRYMMVKSRIP